jgi:hypothetical protein
LNEAALQTDVRYHAKLVRVFPEPTPPARMLPFCS